MKSGLRVDIDCTADVMAIPALIEILEKYDSKATFFITTGPDDTFRNAHHYSGSKFFDLPLRRYFSSFFLSLFNKHVESHRNLRMLLDSDHEIGLHGYKHYEWMYSLKEKNKEEILDMISKGCKLFDNEFGFSPRCFSSPGFRTSDQYLLALEEFDFEYSSDFHGSKIFYPEVNGNTLNTIQVPVSMLSLCELDKNDNKVIMKVNEQIKNGYFTFYIHPSCEPIFRRDLLENILILTGGTLTISEML